MYTNNKCKSDRASEVVGCPDLNLACPNSLVQVHKHIFKNAYGGMWHDGEEAPELRTGQQKRPPSLRASQSTYGQAFIQHRSHCFVSDGPYDEDDEDFEEE